jgi:hypothetical protein
MALDPKLVNLAKAIRQQESGGDPTRHGASGEFGAYQFLPSTWNSYAKQAGVNVPLTSSTIEDQNKVAYTALQRMQQEHPEWNVGNFASAWNAGEGEPNAYKGTFNNGRPSKGTNSSGVAYDVPGYATAVNKYYQTYKGQTLGSNINRSDTEIASNITPNPDGVAFPSSPNDSPVAAGLKTLGNIPGSLFNFAKGAVDTVNPISTIGRLAQIPGVIGDISKQGQTPGQLTGNLAQGAYDSIVPSAGRELISAAGGALTGNKVGNTDALGQAQSDITNDPIGQVAPFVLAGEGGLKAIGKGDLADTAISKTAQTVTRPIEQVAGGIGKGLGAIPEYAINQILGTKTGAVKTITENPDAFRSENMAQTSRVGLGEEIKAALDAREESLSETGKAYEPLRNAVTEDGKPATVRVDPNFLPRAIRDIFGLGVKGGKIVAKTTSRVTESRDVRAVQDLYDMWQPAFAKGVLSNKEYFNFRKKLSKLSGYERDLGKSTDLENLSSIFRNKLNRHYGGQIPGLRDVIDREGKVTKPGLDTQFAGQIEAFKRLRKGILDKDGNLTTAGIQKIANSVGRGKDLEVARLEEIVPGITRKARILKVIEELEDLKGRQVGTYARGGLAAIGIGTLNIPAIIASILATPEIALPLLRQYGYAKPLVDAALNALKSGAAAINTVPTNPALQQPVKLPTFGRTPQLPTGQ